MKNVKSLSRENEKVVAILQKEPKFFELLLSSLPGIFYVYSYPEMQLVFWNKMHETLLGYTSKEMSGRLLTDWYGLENKQAVLDALEIVMEKGQNSIEAPLLAKDGNIVNMFLTGIRFEVEGHLYLIGTGTDISLRKQIEQHLIESESKYRDLIEWSPTSIFIHSDLKIVYANPAMCKDFGATSQEDLLDLPLLQIVHPDFHQIVLSRVESILNGKLGIEPAELQHLKLDGTTINTEIQGKLITYQGKPAVYVAIRDITDCKKAKYGLEETLTKLRRSLKGTISVISKMVDLRDPYTSSHQKNVAVLARKIGKRMNLSSERIEELRMAALIHDIGKVDVPTEILCKPTKLKPAEFELIKGHAQAGYDVLVDSELSETLKQTILQHHERLDGSGYPQGLKGDEIILEAQILAVADVVDAMISHRPYRASLGVDAAIIELMKNKGTLYNPLVVDTCFKILMEKK